VTAALRASGRVPHGVPGELFLDGLRETAARIAADVRPIVCSERLEPLVIDETAGDTRLSGVLRNLWPAAQMFYSYSKLAARHEIAPWIRHLALCLAERPGHPRVTRLVGRKGDHDEVCTIVFGDVPADGAQEILAKLLHLYWLGQTVPLPFFPNSARDYLKALDRHGEARALEKAGYQFLGGPYVEMAECKDANVKLAFGGADPLSPSFRPAAEGSEDVPWFGALAAAIFGDLERYRKEE
jgi:exodeoxyribonuclease V gamma subunit